MLFIISLLLLTSILSIQALSDDGRYNVEFRQQILKNSNLIHDNRKQVIMTFGNDKFTCLLPNENNRGKKSHQYWTYEYCHDKHVRQFHVESVNGELKETVSYHLGVYDNKRPVKLSDDNKLSHLWSEGDVCDITGQPRSVELLYECGRDTINHEDRLISFKEVSTCQYQITIATPRLCVHPSQTHSIECFPL